jgi:hypothetical protein
MGAIQDLLTEVPLSAVLKERVALADQKYERAREEIEGYKKRIAALECEVETLRAQVPADSPSALDSEAERALVHLFRATEIDARDAGYMARTLGIEQGVLRFHLDRLADAGFAGVSGARDGHVYWMIKPDGRRYVMERKLIAKLMG